MKKLKIIVFLGLLSLLVFPQRMSSANLAIVQDPPPPVVKSAADYISEIFGKNAKIATAVFKHESKMRLDAINYNCRYNGKSTFCKQGDRKNAISVDCGIGQVNVKGAKACPKHLLTLEGNMKAVARIYKEQGLRAWASYTNKQYLKFM